MRPRRGARRGADEHHLARQLRAGFDQGVLLRMDAAAVSGLCRVAAVRQAPGVAVVADAENLGQIAGGDDAADLQPGAGGPLGQLLGHAHVDLLERDALGGDFGLLDRFFGCHQSQVNRLVYTHLSGLECPTCRCSNCCSRCSWYVCWPEWARWRCWFGAWSGVPTARRWRSPSCAGAWIRAG